MKITFEIENDGGDCCNILPLQCARMRRAIGCASEMIVNMMNYGPDTWEKTCEDLQYILEVLDVFLIEPK